MNGRMRAVTTWSLAAGVGVLAMVLLLTEKRAETQGPDPIPVAERVSVRTDGGQANSNSTGPVVSGDGTCVAFHSDATNLLPQGPDADTNAARDVFLFHRDIHVQERVSLTDGGQQANGPSQLQGFRPAIDQDCTCVAFSSDATNLVPNDTNGRTDVFLRDLGVPTTIRVSVGDGVESDGSSSFPSVSADCQIVAFQSSAANLVDDDGNLVSDIFVFNRGTGLTTRVSVGDAGEANGANITPAISADGRCVAFGSAATNLLPGDSNGTTDVYVACDGEITCRASVSSTGLEADGISFLPALSADGNIVAFKSNATNLVPDDRNRVADVFVHDCASGETQRVSVGDIGQEGNDIAIPPSVSGDGRFVAFGSYASNLLLGRSTGSKSQVYVRDLLLQTTLIISTDPNGNPGNNSVPDLPPSISLDGMVVGFASLASNLVSGDTNQALDAFVRGNETATPTPTTTPTGTNTPRRPTQTPEPIPCEFDTDCPLGQVCRDDVCVPAPTATPRKPCEDDDDCPPPQICGDDGFCFDPSTPTPTPTPLPTCMMDSDCPDGQHCRAMVCVPKRECDDDDPVLDRVNCRGVRETCLDGLCECGGDCNTDGIVFGTELTKMVCVVMNDCPLTNCRAGDFDGDGEIMGSELTMALRNLTLGCPGEGAPLIFAQQRTDEPRLIEVEDNEVAAGQFVDIDFAVTGGGEVTTAQLDVLLPTNVIDIDAMNPVQDCRIATRLAFSHRLDADFPQRPVTPAGQVRLRFVVWDDMLRRSFSDGPIASCRFKIQDDVADGNYSLAYDRNRLEIGDTNGDEFGADVTGGALTVLPIPCEGDDDCPPPLKCINGTCQPEPPGECDDPSDCLAGQACVEQECVCGGDCNGDGMVLPSEVVTGIQIFGGTVPLATCPPADVDGNTMVLPNDVITAIQNFGLGCPPR